jgi:hypothetical protein
MSRIRMSFQAGETPDNFFSDYEWIKANQSSLLDKYGEASILVYKERVVGFGRSYFDAIENAEKAANDSNEIITPVHYHLTRNPYRIGHLRRKSVTE